MSEWVYLPTNNIEECVDYWVASKTPSGTVTCLAYYDEGEWIFADNMIAYWEGDMLEAHKFKPYAIMEYFVPDPPKETNER